MVFPIDVVMSKKSENHSGLYCNQICRRAEVSAHRLQAWAMCLISEGDPSVWRHEIRAYFIRRSHLQYQCNSISCQRILQTLWRLALYAVLKLLRCDWLGLKFLKISKNFPKFVFEVPAWLQVFCLMTCKLLLILEKYSKTLEICTHDTWKRILEKNFKIIKKLEIIKQNT